jgi:hypothetical protein
MYTTAQRLTMNQRFARILVASMVFATMCMAASPATACPAGRPHKGQGTGQCTHFAHHRVHETATVQVNTILVLVEPVTVGDTGMTAAEYEAFLNCQCD